MKRTNSLLPLLLVLTAALAILAVLGASIDLGYIYLRGLDGAMNDQAGYIVVARQIVDTGHAASTGIYPSVLNQHTTKNYFYLPGHYWALATSFRIFGYSAFTAFVSSLAGYLIATVATFVIALRRYGKEVALFATFLVALFPLNLVLAYSAMTEMALTAATMVVILVFLLLPPRLRPWLGPILVVLPLLFRETGAFVAVVMFVLLLARDDRTVRLRIWDAAIFLIGAGLAVFLVMRSDLSQGRPSLTLNNLVSDRFGVIYTDAFALEGMHFSAGDIAALVWRKFLHNIHELKHPGHSMYGPWMWERVSFYLLLLPVPIGLIVSRRRHDALAEGVSASLTLVLVLMLGTYTIWGYRGARALLFLQPLGAIVVAAAVWHFVPQGRIRLVFVALTIAIYATFSIRSLYVVYRPQKESHRQGEQYRRIVERIGHDDRKVLVAPDELSLDYFLAHYPVRVSFLPANLATLRLMESRYEIGTIVYPISRQGVRPDGVLTQAELRAGGWKGVALVRMGRKRFLVLRK